MLSEHQTKKCNYPFPSQKNQKESGRNSFTFLPINLQNYLPLSPFHLLASCYAKGVLSVWISPSLDSDSHLLLPLRNSMLLLLMFFHLISFQDFSYTQFQLSPILKKFSLPSISFSRNICIGVVFIPSPPPPQSMSDHFITPPLHHSTQSAAPKSPMTWILLNSMGLIPQHETYWTTPSLQLLLNLLCQLFLPFEDLKNLFNIPTSPWPQLQSKALTASISTSSNLTAHGWHGHSSHACYLW